ncbi:SUMF1/EgtB/PvdO family nonheme iron enzyme [candidate division KSB1 bacterium]|nr:SUMF1/EgtB/PvdO family nonheme iron enzyme [bacterium]NUM68749.1 SUMF1/EgtB/PvdO family nonheme iron enzyme [candidate division KSB1 bacterium]
MQTKRALRIVLSSPSDVADECRALEGVIAELNRGVAHERKVTLELTHWQTDAYPGFHPDGPQGVIDPILNIQDCDILLAIFWKRFGTPAKGAASGAEHEIRTAIKARQDSGRPWIMIYFKEADRPLKTPEELRQYAAVLEFKQEISPLGLFWTFEDTADFERKVRQHLTHYILDHIHPTAGEPTTASSATRVQELIRSHRRNLQHKFSTIHLFGEKRRRSIDAGDMADIEHGFVPLHLLDWREENRPPAVPLDIDNVFFNDTPPRHFLLRGLPGSGKTTLLRYLAHRYVGADSDCIPVYLRCKSLDLSEATLENFVQQQLNQDSDSPEIFAALCAQERFLEKNMVLLFDGLDEIEQAETGNRIAAELEKLGRKYPRAKIIVASRPIALRQGDFAQFRRFDVLPLTPAMIQAYVEKWFAGEPEKIAALEQSLAQRRRIRDLAANPFLLSMICFTFEQGGDAALLERRSDLYEECTQYLLRRAYDPESSASAKSNYEHTIEILKDVSLRFFLWKEDDFPVDHVNVIGRAALSAETLGRPEDFLNRLERETGLIQRAKEGFTFVHRSLWEYFTALALRDKINDPRRKLSGTNFVIRHAANPDWEEVVRLYAGLLQDHKNVVELVNGLWNLNRPLALRVTTEVKTPALELLKPLIDQEEGNQSKLLLIDSLEQSLHLIAPTEQQKLVQETLDILLIKCAERDCEVIYHGQELLERLGMQPLQPGGLIYELFDLDHAAERQQKLMRDPDNHFEWIEVEGGEFWMGDDEHEPHERPAHQVKLNSFCLAKHPVTNRMQKDFPFGDKCGHGGDDCPAVGNTWFEAHYFCLWLGGRLPTEAEWEYAARGGKKAKRTQYYFGDAVEELPKHAWFGDTARRQAHAVNEPNPHTGKENLNPLGLANMLGNVWEWCADWYDSDYYDESPEENPIGPETGTQRVLRGGSWDYNPLIVRCAYRIRNSPTYRNYLMGFRCAQDSR